VLSDPILRNKYDKDGKEDVAPVMDPKSFFAMVFGSEDFELLVGTLKVATIAMNEGIMTQAEAEFRQRKREVECALNLRNIVMNYDPNYEEVFVNSLRISELASTCFGEGLIVLRFDFTGLLAYFFLIIFCASYTLRSRIFGRWVNNSHDNIS